MRANSCALWILLVVAMALAPTACAPEGPADLVLEEHPLAGPPGLEPLTFLPAEGTQESVLALHAAQRAQGFPDMVAMIGGAPAIRAIGDDDAWTAVMVTSAQDPPEQTVVLRRGEEVIQSIPAGLPSPILPLQGLWTYDGHWALEIVYAGADIWQGRVYVDGTLINTAEGYQEAFGFQLLDGKPFYLFERDGRIGYSYAGSERSLGYDRVPHYHCCSESTLNPIRAQSMLAFFAQREGTWYYVELGRFDT